MFDSTNSTRIKAHRKITFNVKMPPAKQIHMFNRRSSEIQGTALGKCLQAWPIYIIYIYRSRPAGVAQSSHAFVGGTVSTWAR